MKRMLSLMLACCLLCSCIALLSGCSSDEGKDWPVAYGDAKITKEPKNVVVLSDKLADIIAYIGYDIKLVGRSTECDQEHLYVVPTMGSAAIPDMNAITAAGADLVIADNTLSPTVKDSFAASGITVVIMEPAADTEALHQQYIDLGTVLGGAVTGAQKGEDSFTELFDTLNTLNTATSSIVQTTVYLYLDESGQLCSFVKDTLPHKFFNYNGGANVLMNQTEPAVLANDVRISSPAYIFYDTPDVLAYMSSDPNLSNVSGLVQNRTLQIPKKNFERCGITIEKTIYQMLSFIESFSKATPDEATAAPAATVAATAAPTAAATDAPDAPVDETPAEEVYSDAYAEDYAAY